MNAKWDRLLAVYEMLGGLTGLALGFFFLWGQAFDVRALWEIGAELLFVLSFVAGLLLWHGRPLGLALSRLVQSLQILQFSVAGLAYVFMAGPAVLLGISSGGGTYFIFDQSLYLQAEIHPALKDAPTTVVVNLAALVILCYLALRSDGDPAVAEPALQNLTELYASRYRT